MKVRTTLPNPSPTLGPGSCPEAPGKLLLASAPDSAIAFAAAALARAAAAMAVNAEAVREGAAPLPVLMGSDLLPAC